MKFFYLLFLISLFFSSCRRQEAPSIEKSFDKTAKLQRVEACSQLSFNQNFLFKSNVEKLFSCTRWDLRFPHFFQAIKNIDKDSWNHFFQPLSKIFFENQEKRDRYLYLFKKLDEMDALDDFGYILTSLNEKNLYDEIHDFYLCLSNADKEDCSKGGHYFFTQKDLKDFLHFLNFKKDDFVNLARFFKIHC